MIVLYKIYMRFFFFFIISIDHQKRSGGERERKRIEQKERVKAIVDRSDYCGRKFSSFGLFLRSRFTKFIVQRTIRLLSLLLSLRAEVSFTTIHSSNEINFSFSKLNRFVANAFALFLIPF